MLGARINLSLLLIIGSSYSFASTLIPNKDGVPSGKKLTDGSNTMELPKSPVQMLERSEPFSNPRLERDAAECQEGAEWTDDCNRCRCQNGLPTCTSRICLHDQECVEGSSWTFGCNTCYCFNGKPACTSMLCLHEQASECAGGTHWMEKCNPCYCKFGRSFCTQDDCVDELSKQGVQFLD
ncbi:unnamed protein product [Meganyctiphanes norvegica]|uniref:Pacifastin domain-containing protein n=1 Tax=Meganyctiphanes norvegica TaxID=48144 RepID=A0AAV2RHC3_MEGNR